MCTASGKETLPAQSLPELCPELSSAVRFWVPAVSRFNSLQFRWIFQDGNKTNTIHNLLFCSNSPPSSPPWHCRSHEDSGPHLPIPTPHCGAITRGVGPLPRSRAVPGVGQEEGELCWRAPRLSFINLLVQAQRWPAEVKHSTLATFQLFVLSFLTDCSHV